MKTNLPGWLRVILVVVAVVGVLVGLIWWAATTTSYEGGYATSEDFITPIAILVMSVGVAALGIWPSRRGHTSTDQVPRSTPPTHQLH